MTIGTIDRIRRALVAALGPEHGRWLVLLLISASPLLVDLALALGHLSVMEDDHRATTALLYYAALNVFALSCPYYTWHRLVRLADTLDDSLTAPEDRHDLVEWLRARTQFGRQAATCGAMSCISLVGLKFVVEPSIGDVVTFGPASYVAVGLTAAIGWEDLYWVWQLPLLVRKVCSSPSFTVHWHAPARTPVVEGLSRLLGWTAVLGIAGGATLALTVAYSYSLSGARAVMFFATIAGLMTSATFFFTGLYPQYLLFRAVAQSKAETLRVIANHCIGRLDLAQPGMDLDEQAQWIEIWHQVDASPSWTLRNETIVQYLAALLGVVLSVVLTIAIGSR